MVKLASSRVFRCLMCLLLICCMLVNISPVRAHATAISSATAVGIAAALVVGSILIGLDIMPSSSVLSSSFQNLVNAIVSALPDEFIVTGVLAQTAVKMFLKDGITYAPRNLVSFVLNYVSTAKVESVPLIERKFEPFEYADIDYSYSDFVDYINSRRYDTSLGGSALYEMFLASTVCVPMKVIQTQVTRYGYLFGSGFKLNTHEIDGEEVTVVTSSSPILYVDTFYGTPGISASFDTGHCNYCDEYCFMAASSASTLSKTKYILGNPAYASSYSVSSDAFSLGDTYSDSLDDDKYLPWVGSGISIPNTGVGSDTDSDSIGLPVSVPATIEDVAASSRSDVIAGTETKAETVTIDDTISDTTTDTSTGWLSTVVSWLQSILNAIKSLISGITTPIVNAIAEVVAAVKAIAIPTTAEPPGFDSMTLPSLKNFFPFCIPFDLYAMMQALCADPVAPCFTFATSFLGHLYTVDIDLSPWEDVAVLVRYMITAIHIVALTVATRKFIKW